MKERILVPLDGSTFAEQALPVALRLARERGGVVHLVQVHEAPIVMATPDFMVPLDPAVGEDLRRGERDYLQATADRLASTQGVGVHTDLVEGQPAAALAQYARDAGAALIVMMTHGRSGLSRVWLGSVAEGVIRQAGAPVLLLRPDAESAGFEGTFPPRHVLIPLDGSDLARTAVDPAVWVGMPFNARYTLMRVVLPLPQWAGSTTESAPTGPATVEVREHVLTALEQTARTMKECGLDVDVAAVTGTVPALSILEFAKHNGVDLIAMASHGRSGWSRIMLGSVADKVLRGASIPVLLLRPDSGQPRPLIGSPM